MSKIPRIAFVGDLTVDRYVKQNEIHLGGSSLTGAMWAKRLGAASSVVAAVGSDDAGKQYISMVTREHIDNSYLHVLPGRTSSIDILTGEDGERRYGVWDPGVLGTWCPDSHDIDFLHIHDAISLVVYDKTVHILDAFEGDTQEAPLRVVDFGDMSHFGKKSSFVSQYLPAIDVAVFGLDRDTDRRLIGQLKQLSLQTGKLVLITLNRHGAVAFQGGENWEAGVENINVVDATGAGDSFLAGFLVSYLETGDVAKSLDRGNTIASTVIRQIGAY